MWSRAESLSEPLKRSRVKMVSREVQLAESSQSESENESGIEIETESENNRE